MIARNASSVSIFLRLLFTQQGEQLVRGIRVVVIPLALLGKEEMKQSNVPIEDKSTLISFAVLLMLLFPLLLFFLLVFWGGGFKLPIQLKCKFCHTKCRRACIITHAMEARFQLKPVSRHPELCLSHAKGSFGLNRALTGV